MCLYNTRVESGVFEGKKKIWEERDVKKNVIHYSSSSRAAASRYALYENGFSIAKSIDFVTDTPCDLTEFKTLLTMSRRFMTTSIAVQQQRNECDRPIIGNYSRENE